MGGQHSISLTCRSSAHILNSHSVNSVNSDNSSRKHNSSLSGSCVTGSSSSSREMEREERLTIEALALQAVLICGMAKTKTPFYRLQTSVRQCDKKRHSHSRADEVRKVTVTECGHRQRVKPVRLV